MTDTEKLGKVYKILNPTSNGGETVAITAEIFDNGDTVAGLPGGIYTISRVDLHSYGNEASMSLPNLTPEFLRELANELETEIYKAKIKLVAND